MHSFTFISIFPFFFLSYNIFMDLNDGHQCSSVDFFALPNYFKKFILLNLMIAFFYFISSHSKTYLFFENLISEANLLLILLLKKIYLFSFDILITILIHFFHLNHFFNFNLIWLLHFFISYNYLFYSFYIHFLTISII